MNFKKYFGANFEYAEREDTLMDIKALIISSDLTSFEIETLHKAFSLGSMESGETPCKESRGSLIEKGLICQTSSKSVEYGFSVTYPLGYKVISALSLLQNNR